MDEIPTQLDRPPAPAYRSLNSPTFDVSIIFGDAFKLLGEGFGQFLSIFVLIQLPLIIIQMLLLSPKTPTIENLDEFGRLMVSTMFFAFLGLFGTLNLLTAARHRIAGAPKSFHEVFFGSILKFPMAVFAAVILGIVVFAGALALIIPGIIFYVLGCCFMQAIAIKDQGVFSGLIYSYELVRGNWWFVLAFQLIVFAITAIVSLPLIMLDSLVEVSFPFKLAIYIAIGIVELILNLAGVMMFFNLESIRAHRGRVTTTS